jgi:hypothetical protein
VSADPELADAVAGRAHWQSAGDGAAVYAPPGSEVSVRVQRVRQPTKRERYVASFIRGGRATHTVPCDTAVEAVRLAARIRPA